MFTLSSLLEYSCAEETKQSINRNRPRRQQLQLLNKEQGNIMRKDDGTIS
jgi:hypothetical protein